MELTTNMDTTSFCHKNNSDDFNTLNINGNIFSQFQNFVSFVSKMNHTIVNVVFFNNNFKWVDNYVMLIFKLFSFTSFFFKRGIYRTTHDSF